MDPNSGRVYPTVDAAREAGVENPVELTGRLEDVERISAAVQRLHNTEKKRARNKAAKQARRANR